MKHFLFLGLFLASITGASAQQTVKPCMAVPAAPGGFAPSCQDVGSSAPLAVATYSVASKTRIQSLATANPLLEGAGAHAVQAIVVGNSGAADAWIKIYDKVTAPTCGTDVPVASFYLPKGTQQQFSLSGALKVTLGLGTCIVGGAADSSTTAVIADQVTGTIIYN